MSGKGSTTTISSAKVLQGTVLCCACFDKGIQAKVVECGNRLGAVWKQVVTKDMTALVVDRAGGSDEYLQAVKLKVPVITYYWLYLCFNEKKYIHWKNEHYVSPFWGLTVVVTGLSGSKRQEINDLVTKHGGKYRDILQRDETTHLISNTSTSSPKYDAAIDWGWDNIKIVNETWIYDCVKESRWFPEITSKYRVDGNTLTNALDTAMETITSRLYEQGNGHGNAPNTLSEQLPTSSTNTILPSSVKITTNPLKRSHSLSSTTTPSITRTGSSNTLLTSKTSNKRFRFAEEDISSQPQDIPSSSSTASAVIPSDTPFTWPFVSTGNEWMDMEKYLLSHVPVERLPVPRHSWTTTTAADTSEQSILTGKVCYLAGYPPIIRDYLSQWIVLAGGHVSPILYSDISVVILGEQASDSFWKEWHRVHHYFPRDCLCLNMIGLWELLAVEQRTCTHYESTLKKFPPDSLKNE